MARRPKRSLSTELLAHRQLATAALETCSALVTLEPEIAEFFACRKFLTDAVTEIDRKLKALEAEPGAAYGPGVGSGDGRLIGPGEVHDL